MKPEREVTIWPTRENFQRFADLCDDEVAGSFEEFEEAAIIALNDLARSGVHIDKIAFDPDKMAQWCRANFGQVDAVARAAYAAFIALSN